MGLNNPTFQTRKLYLFNDAVLPCIHVLPSDCSETQWIEKRHITIRSQNDCHHDAQLVFKLEKYFHLNSFIPINGCWAPGVTLPYVSII